MNTSDNKIDWKRKLSSRKFWVALIGFISAILYAFNIAETEITQIASIITAGSTLIIYILTEGYVDANQEVTFQLPPEVPQEQTNVIGFHMYHDEEMEEEE